MNRSRTIAGALLILFCWYGYPTHFVSGAENTSEGTISLWYDETHLQCVFPAVSAIYTFAEDPHPSAPQCASFISGNGFFELNNVPSATRIFFVNGRPKAGQLPQGPKYCGLSDSQFGAFGWWELVTTKEPTTTSPLKINFLDLRTLKPGETVKPGVRLKAREVFANPANPDEVNCMIIEVSPLSP